MAIWFAASKGKSQHQCEEDFGVCERTLSNDLKRLRNALNVANGVQLKTKCFENENTVKAAIENMTFEANGRKHFLSGTENDIFCEIAHLQDESGYGYGRKACTVIKIY